MDTEDLRLGVPDKSIADAFAQRVFVVSDEVVSSPCQEALCKSNISLGIWQDVTDSPLFPSPHRSLPTFWE